MPNNRKAQSASTTTADALEAEEQSRVDSTTTSAKADALEARAPNRSATSPKCDLDGCADNFLPIARKPSARENFESLNYDNKIPTTETCLSRTKVSPVVEGNPQSPKNLQTPM